MPITVVCPSCSTKMSAPDSAAGKHVKCPKAGCGEIIEVPEPDAPAFEVVDDRQSRKKRRDADDEDVDDRPRRRRSSREDDQDEDERPARKRKPWNKDEDEEERPRRRRARDDDDDDEDDDDAYYEPTPGRCPNCNSSRSSKVSYTWWGGILGPAIFGLVRCNKCRTQYSKKSGKEIGLFHVVMYTIAILVIAGIIGFVVFLSNQ